MNNRLRFFFTVSLFAWRGTLTAIPLIFTKLLTDAQFNSFSVLFSIMMLLGGVVGFGQPQYSYSLMNKKESDSQENSFGITVLSLTLVVSIVAYFAIGYIPHSPLEGNSLFRIAILLCSIGFFLVDYFVTKHIVAAQLSKASQVYLIATPCLMLSLSLVFLFNNPLWLLIGSTFSLLALLFCISDVKSFDFSVSELVDRFRFGFAQTLILLFGASTPSLIHLALPALNLDVKGSKYVTIFTATVGVFLFFVTSSIVARSKEIAGRNSVAVHAHLDNFIMIMILLSLPSVGIAFLIERLMLGTTSFIFGLSFWFFLVSQIVIIYCRYICFANKATIVDLIANVAPLIITMGLFFFIYNNNLLSFNIEAIVLVMPMMATMSACIYYFSIKFGFVINPEMR